jgi:8-oxo-dGTP pyrophosphatase MutT (NUDIX family)
MQREKSCGVLVFQDRPRRSFLLLHHKDRIDFPKGHVKKGETDLACALRELEEETGIAPHAIELDRSFHFTSTYVTHNKRGAVVEKTVVMFQGEVGGPCAIHAPDHEDYEWVPWAPPHSYDTHPTLHRLLHAWAEHERNPHLQKRNP